MCSFLYTNKTVDSYEKANHFMKRRGPDATTLKFVNDSVFLHNILSITGDFITQPFIDEEAGVVCLYNGEIYNYQNFGNYISDGLCLIPLYNEHGNDFVKYLDGEFAIVLVDYKKKKIILSTDVFATKPLWYSLKDKIGVASYESALKALNLPSPKKLEANTTLIIDLNSKAIIDKKTVYDFCLKQHKTDVTDWINTFSRSISKRTHNLREKLFIGLSSGYDSGAIACELNNQNIPYKAYSVAGSENINIIQERLKLMKPNSSGEFLYDDRWQYKQYINEHVEEFKYRVYSSSSDYNEFNLRLQDDNGSSGLSLVCSKAKEEGRKVYLSGSGSDEIFSDYGFNGTKIYPHSNFGGLFPDNLEDVFPWPSFYDSTMISYLAKEEYVAGSYGIETRYPYLDKDVVQEFLWLDNKIKNANYKSVLFEYFKTNNYPFEPNKKIGF
jgi:asparagine synthetase B (glutamine-hydrolysing)